MIKAGSNDCQAELENVRRAEAAAGSCSSRLALFSLLPSGLAFAWLISKAQWFWTHQPDLQFGWVVVLLCGYLFWEAWESRPAPEFRWTWLRCAALLFGFALLFLVQVYQAAFGTQPASMSGLAAGVLCLIVGNIGYVFGRAGIRHFLFSFAFLLIAMPLPSLVHGFVVGGLQSKVTSLNVEILNLIGIPAQRVGSLIRLPSCTVGVDEACSGIRSLQSTLMATLFIGHLTLRRTGLKGLLVASGVLLAVLGNLVRSLFLSYTANARGIHALESAHDTAGWSILLFTAAGVALVAFALARLEQATRPGGPRNPSNPGVTSVA